MLYWLWFHCLFYRRTPAGRYGFVSYEPPDYMNILPEDRKLVEVSSNIWGTKFKIIGTHFETLPTYLGQVSFYFSLKKKLRFWGLLWTDFYRTFPSPPPPLLKVFCFDAIICPPFFIGDPILGMAMGRVHTQNSGFEISLE